MFCFVAIVRFVVVVFFCSIVEFAFKFYIAAASQDDSQLAKDSMFEIILSQVLTVSDEYYYRETNNVKKCLF